MKRIQMTIAALVVALGLAGTGGANGQSNDTATPVSVRKSDRKKVRLVTPGPVDLAIIDAEGIVLYKGDLRTRPGAGTSINLENLPDGHYFLTATNNHFWVSQGLTIRNEELMVDTQNPTALVKPALTPYGKNKFEIALTGARPMHISLYDRQNGLVFTETYREGGVHRYDLNRLPEGSYTFVVGPDFKQFTERIAVQR